MSLPSTHKLIRALLLAAVGVCLLLWRASAQEPTRIAIDNIDASGFPEVVIDLSVVDDLGVPFPELTAADFQVFEDGRKVPPGSLVLEADESQPIGLVFAVDLSTEVADLEEIKSGLRTLVGRMRSGDQGMLLTFEDSVQVAQPLTSSPQDLLAAIDRLTVAGNYTSLNRVTVEAMNRAELLSVNRRAVVIVTDSVENINSLPLADVYSRADQVDIPLYLFAYSPKSQPASAMEAYGLRIKAKPFVTDTAGATRLRLLALGSLFERGYRLRYTSSLPADGSEYNISINLVGGGSVGGGRIGSPVVAQVTLVALPGAVDVSLPGLDNGQTVAGFVTLAPEILAPGPVQRVDYTLDGQTIATVTAPPWAYTWDTGGLVQGSHVLGVRAIDSAGNLGESFVTVTVVDPLLLEASVDRSRVFVGDEIAVTVQAEAVAGVAGVDLLVDGALLDRRTAPPYIFLLDSSSYAEGEHIVTVQASDRNGYAESTKFTLNLLPPPPRFIFSNQTWLRIFAIAAIVLVILLAWLLLLYLAGLARRRRRRRFSMALDNLGNAVSAFLVRVDDPAGALRFHLLHQGMALAGRTVRDWVPLSREEWENLQFRAQTMQVEQAQAAYAAQAPVEEAVPSVTERAGATKASVGSGLGQAKAGAGAGIAKLKNVGQRTSQAAEIAGAGAGLLYTLGGFLPASLGGAALRRAGQGSMSAYRGARSVEHVQRQAGQIQSATSGPQTPLTAAQRRDLERAQAAGFGTAHMEELLAQQEGKEGAAAATAPAPAAAPPVADPAAANGKAPGTALARGEPARGQTRPRSGGAARVNGHGPYGDGRPPTMPDVRFDAEGVPYRLVTRRIDDVWTETPSVEPGDSLYLELVIEPVHPRRGQRLPFRIASRSLDAEEMPLVIHEATVDIRGRSWLSWFVFPLLISGGAVAVVVFMLWFLLADFGLI